MNTHTRRSPLSLLPVWLACFFFLSVEGEAANRLAQSVSPYLLQHAEDPVDWQPWDKEALARAQREDKLIFLSIGYSSCHWCHKMGRDTFADPRIAKHLNAHYVTILVDREERPDLDSYYLQVAEAMNGESGWPLNVILTPTLLPLFASSYLPPRPRLGLTGLQDVLEGIHTAWVDTRDDLLRDESLIRRQLQALTRYLPVQASTVPPVDPRDRAVHVWRKKLDARYGGFGTSSKFLHPEVLSLFLRQSLRTGDADLSASVFFTLDRMAAGGVRDQLGGAFHRYAADRFWQVPHFEIMLYDNALMARVYLEAYQHAQSPRYAFVARQILDDLLDRFWLPGGGFASALDADSRHTSGESLEGGFYTWQPEEILSLLGPEEGARLQAAFLDPARGTVGGRGILRLQTPPESLRAQHHTLQPLLQRLAAKRATRPPPHRDDKMITAWNALAVSALAQGARVFGEARYLQAAREGMHVLLTRPWHAGELRHIWHKGQVGEGVFLEDHAFLIQSLLDLYETDFDPAHLEKARTLAEDLFTRFQPHAGAPFQWVPLARGETPVPQVPLANQQGIPSGNAIALTSLARLGLFMWDETFQNKVATILQGLHGFLVSEGHTAPELLRALDYQEKSAREVILVGPRDAVAIRHFMREVHQRFLPETITAWVDPAHPPDPERWPALANRPLANGQPAAYVCIHAVCKQPVTDPERLAQALVPFGVPRAAMPAVQP